MTRYHLTRLDWTDIAALMALAFIAGILVGAHLGLVMAALQAIPWGPLVVGWACVGILVVFMIRSIDAILLERDWVAPEDPWWFPPVLILAMAVAWPIASYYRLRSNV
jgi:hypothetical protein